MAKYCAIAPYAWPSATWAPSTWCSPALPCTCSAASAKRIMPEAPMGLLESTPPDGLTGNDARAGPVGRRTRLEEVDRIPQHHRVAHLLDGDVGEPQVCVRVLHRVEAVLHRDPPADVLRRARPADVGAHPRSEDPARSH